MQLLDHVSISVGDLTQCEEFYDAIMSSLGCEKIYRTQKALGYGVRCRAGQESHSYLTVIESPTANLDESRHWCFKASSRDAVVNFHRIALAAGGTCNGPPGIREHYHENYYACFLLDPFGNRVESVFHGV